MRKVPFEKSVRFREPRISEEPKESWETEGITEPRHSTRQTKIAAGKMFMRRPEFPYRGVLTQKPVVEVPLLPAKYFRQLQRKEIPAKPKAPIEEGVKTPDILERILEGEMKVTPKELWAIAPRLWTMLKDILTSQYSNIDDKEALRAPAREVTETHLIELDNLTEPVTVQTEMEIALGEMTELWTVKDSVVQYSETLHPMERPYQVFASEKGAQEESAPEMSHLRVVPVLVNGVAEEEALLDSGSQIVSMTQEVVAANKITWDPSLSIQLQSTNRSLSRTCGLAKNVPFTLGDVTVLLQAHVMDVAPYKILLGRPFDTIRESTIVNDCEGNQTINITCPNTGARAAIPTCKQGLLPRKPESLAHFQ